MIVNKLIFILFLVISTNVFSQSSNDSIIVLLENGITSVLTNSDKSQFAISYSGNNTISRNKLNFNTNSNYSLVYSNSITSNELLFKNNLLYDKLFISHVFNYSLSRKIESDNLFGVGVGFKKIYKHFYYGISYAIMYDKTNYIGNNTIEIGRHSLRFKFKINTKVINVNMEYYYQPDITSFGNFIVYGNTKITLYPNKKLNFIIQDALNFRSVSNIKMINNTTFGISYSFNKNIKKDR